ncbi:dinitrogenase iron-molybdenum cofactor N-terminal domain-containing protein [Vibrio sp. MA40-2]|uniref:dinitrogenase iron-molybdenum cofactor N-terminal domain-containing protein n=1 Tax=Vibrio sp. MA40-2 TaxID=3391828 RepID=UPI0039A6DE44
MDTHISNEAALRVALASKLLPSVDVKSLLGLLIQHLGEPLSEQKLTDLSLKTFKVLVTSLDNSISRKQVTGALAVLTSDQANVSDIPKVLDLPPISGPKLRVAVTSNQGELLNGHYGSCLRVLVYEVNQYSHQLVDVRVVNNDLHGEARTDHMLTLLAECQLLFTLSIGGPAAARVTRANIHPVKKPVPTSCSDILSDLNEVIAHNPPPWMKKMMDKDSIDSAFIQQQVVTV